VVPTRIASRAGFLDGLDPGAGPEELLVSGMIPCVGPRHPYRYTRTLIVEVAGNDALTAGPKCPQMARAAG
jgi:hypothetical protein